MNYHNVLPLGGHDTVTDGEHVNGSFDSQVLPGSKLLSPEGGSLFIHITFGSPVVTNCSSSYDVITRDDHMWGLKTTYIRFRIWDNWITGNGSYGIRY